METQNKTCGADPRKLLQMNHIAIDQLQHKLAQQPVCQAPYIQLFTDERLSSQVHHKFITGFKTGLLSHAPL